MTSLRIKQRVGEESTVKREGEGCCYIWNTRDTFRVREAVWEGEGGDMKMMGLMGKDIFASHTLDDITPYLRIPADTNRVLTR